MNDIDPRILKYFDQELSEQERELFLADMETDVNLKRDFQFYSLLIEGIKSEGAEELKEYIKSRVESENPERKTYTWLYAAASAAVLIVGYFAIFKYLETGSLKATKDYITLNDEKASKFKFWNKQKEPAKLERITKPYSSYEDSLRMLGEEDALYAIEEQDDYGISDMDPSSGFQESETKEEAVDNANPEIEKSAIPHKEILIAQQTVIPIQLYSLERNSVSPAPTAAGIENKTKAKSAAPVAKKMEIANDTVSVAKPNESHGRLATIKNNRYLVSLFETYSREEAIVIRKDGNLMHVMVYNMAANNPLLYVINDELYLELGLDKIYKIPAGAQKINNPKPITDKKIIKLIKN